MSGLLDTIVRRRRASASNRLGPAGQNGHPPSTGDSSTAAAPPPVNGNGHATPAAANGHAPTVNGHTPAVNGHGPAVNGHTPAVNGHPAASTDGQPTTTFTTVKPQPQPKAQPESASQPGPAAQPELERPAAQPELEWPAAQPDLERPAAQPELERPAAQPDLEQDDARRFRQRSRMRRRARYLRSLREVQLRDLGGFLLELHRFDRQRTDLVQAKLQGAAATDAELRALERALGHVPEVGQVREPGIGGACVWCGAVHGSTDRFCATCGEPLSSSGAGASALDQA